MMDMTIGDHNPYSKMLLGWIKNPIIIELDKDNQTTINLSPSYKNGDVIIICDDYDNSKGMFQTFFIIEYLDFSSTLLKKYISLSEEEILERKATIKEKQKEKNNY